MQRQRCVRAVGDFAGDVGDLVFWLLAVELDDSGFCSCWVCLAFFLLGLYGGLLGFGCAFCGRMDVSVCMPRSVVGGDYGVPDYGFGGRDGVRV